ncbi:MAG: arginase [Acidobacteria bacterium]|nr:arginase [Acidobacteriota bacterium]
MIDINHGLRSVRVIGVPLDLGVDKLGVDMGPTAIRYAGLLDALSYAHMPFKDMGDLEVLRNFVLDTYPAEQQSSARLHEIARVSEQLASIVYGAIQENAIPIILGGDHSTSIGGIAGFAKAHDRIGLLWIDAHPDSNTPQTTLTGNIHGMTVAISLGHGYDALVNCFGLSPKIHPEDVCMIGVKDMDSAEAKFLSDMGVRIFSTFDIEDRGIASVMREAVIQVKKHTDSIYVSLDADVMDAQIAPGTGISSKGGLSYREIRYVADYIGANVPVSALDIIEINPLLDSHNSTAEICVELIMALLGVRYTDYEKHYLKNNLLQLNRCNAGRHS